MKHTVFAIYTNIFRQLFTITNLILNDLPQYVFSLSKLVFAFHEILVLAVTMPP